MGKYTQLTRGKRYQIRAQGGFEMSENKSDTAIYDPKFKADDDGIAHCPKCDNEMEAHKDTTGGGAWLCTECRNGVLIQPSHHEHTFLGHDTVLLFKEDDDLRPEFVEYPGGYLKPHCPRCEKPMLVEKMWWDKSDQHQGRCRLVLGYVCKDWKGCGYTQSLKAWVPTKSYDYIKNP